MIIWGKKRIDKKLGYAAEFCPFCRTIQPVEIHDLSMVPHLYFLPLTAGKNLGPLACCTICQLKFPVDASRYARLLPEEPSTLETLLRETFPDLREFYAERLALEKKVQHRRPLQPGERKSLLIEPFESIAAMLEMRFSDSIPLDKETGLSCLLTLLIPLTFSCLAFLFMENIFGLVLKLFSFLAVLVGIGVTVGFIFTTNRRFLRQKICPILAKSLKPLNPTEPEIEAILQGYQQQLPIVGKKIKARILIRILDQDSIQQNLVD